MMSSEPSRTLFYILPLFLLVILIFVTMLYFLSFILSFRCLLFQLCYLFSFFCILCLLLAILIFGVFFCPYRLFVLFIVFISLFFFFCSLVFKGILRILKLGCIRPWFSSGGVKSQRPFSLCCGCVSAKSISVLVCCGEHAYGNIVIWTVFSCSTYFSAVVLSWWVFRTRHHFLWEIKTQIFNCSNKFDEKCCILDLRWNKKKLNKETEQNKHV